jgi:uncharacterized protein with PQ loop repeat
VVPRTRRVEAVPSLNPMDIQILAGSAATAMFALSNVPMVRRALVTRDLQSYSLVNLVLINAANLVYSAYVFALPAGPIWLLHCIYLVTAGVMLALRLRFRSLPARPEAVGAR